MQFEQKFDELTNLKLFSNERTGRPFRYLHVNSLIFFLEKNVMRKKCQLHEKICFFFQNNLSVAQG